MISFISIVCLTAQNLVSKIAGNCWLSAGFGGTVFDSIAVNIKTLISSFSW